MPPSLSSFAAKANQVFLFYQQISEQKKYNKTDFKNNSPIMNS
jgi:hypothetical protein